MVQGIFVFIQLSIKFNKLLMFDIKKTPIPKQQQKCISKAQWISLPWIHLISCRYFKLDLPILYTYIHWTMSCASYNLLYFSFKLFRFKPLSSRSEKSNICERKYLRKWQHSFLTVGLRGKNKCEIEMNCQPVIKSLFARFDFWHIRPLANSAFDTNTCARAMHNELNYIVLHLGSQWHYPERRVNIRWIPIVSDTGELPALSSLLIFQLRYLGVLRNNLAFTAFSPQRAKSDLLILLNIS